MIYNFQAMRAVAALLVTFVHIDIFVESAGLTTRDLAFGNFGVDLFFVLSGFVIVHSTAKGNPTAAAFMANRIIRVVPFYWLLTLCVFAVAVFAPQLLGSTDSNLENLAKSLLFIPYLKANGFVQPVLFVGWTLNYEMFFYAAFAAFLLISKRRVTMTVAFTSIFIVSLCLAVAFFQPNSLILRFFGYPIVLEFVFGMWIALAARRWPDYASPLAWPVLIVAASVLVLHMTTIPDSPRWLAAGAPSAAIIWAMLMLERRGQTLSHPFVQLLGAASYSLYLSHPFVLQGLGKLVEPVNGPLVGIGSALIAIIIAHVVGIVVHRKVEKPLVEWVKHGLGRRRPGPPDEPAATPTMPS